MIHSIPLWWWLAPFSALIALGTSWVLSRKLMTHAEGTPKMIEIASHVREGAMAYLKRQYKVVSIVFVLIFVILVVLSLMGIQSLFVPFAFLSGGFWSGMCGFLGMKTATNSSARTANACRESLNKGLKIAFRGGAIMGLIVVGFGLLDISLWFFGLNYIFDHNIFGVCDPLVASLGEIGWHHSMINNPAFQKLKFSVLTSVLLTYSMGASVQALFARVGGGIFTKAADVGADLVGKVEAGIPEDDPRNPATIADNVGDNVGDVAGMGADLYESFCGSILAATALGASLVLTTQGSSFSLIFMPMVVAGAGILASILGIFVVRTKENATQKELLKSLFIGTGLASVLVLLFLFVLALLNFVTWGIFISVTTGLLVGILIGQTTEYYTSDHYKPTQNISEQCLGGPATVILQGVSTGMISTGLPVILLVLGIMISFISSGGLHTILSGVYGIAFAAIGMLSTLGITLATDAFGPIADNAGGNAAMAGLDPKVRERTDALDSLGNTTAATGKGFAIGSAALTALALIAAYLEAIQQWLSRLAGDTSHFVGKLEFTSLPGSGITIPNVFSTDQLDMTTLVQAFNVTVINPQFICGLFIGGMMCFVFCALTIFAVGDAARDMVNEVRRQFKEIKGIMDGTGKPDYARCVEISTAGAQKAMLLPSLLAIFVPIGVGLLLSIPGVLGLLVGTLTTGFSLAIMLNNAGGAWDNAKKYIETDKYGGKGSDAHKAAVIGDTVGDPWKDTAGPSLNILIKLMTIVSIVFVGLVLKFGFYL